MTTVNSSVYKLLRTRQWSIRTRLMLLACLSFLPFALVSIWQLHVNQNALLEESYKALHLVAGNIKANFDAEMNELREELQITSEQILNADGEVNHDFNAKKLIHLNPKLANISLHGNNKDILFSFLPLDINTPHVRKWMSQININKGFTLSSAYINPTNGRAEVVLSLAITKKNQYFGVLSFTIDLIQLNQHLLRNIPVELDAILIDNKGMILSHAKNGDYWIGRMAATYSAQLRHKTSNQILHFKSINGRSTTYVQHWISEADWSILVGETDESTFETMHRNLKLGIYYFIACLLIALSISWRFSELIARPIRYLADSAHAIAIGKQSTITLSDSAEIDEVASQINVMLAELEHRRLLHNTLTQHYTNVLKSTRDSLFLIDDKNHIIEFNQAALSTYKYAPDTLNHLHFKNLFSLDSREAQFNAWLIANQEDTSLFQAEHQTKDEQHFTVEISSNVLEIENKHYRQCFIRDISERKQLEISLQNRNRALEALRACQQVITQATTLETLLTGICNVLIERNGYLMAWIGAAEFTDGKSVRPLASAGDNSNYISSLNITWADNEAGRGPTGSAIRTEKTVIARSIQTDTNFNRWRKVALIHGFNASIAIPLIINGNKFGALSIYTTNGSSFDADEVLLLEEMATELIRAIDLLQTRDLGDTLIDEVKKNEHRFRMLIELSPIGIYSTTNGVISYANPRFAEILGYETKELLGTWIETIIVREDIDIATHAHEILAIEGQTGNYTLRCKRKDGSLVELGLQEVTAEFDGFPSTLGMAQDISERLRSQSEIKHYISLLEHATESTLEAVSLLVEQRDPYTAGHEKRVGIIASDIGLAMGLSEHAVKGLRLAGMVHDIGKISVPAEILAKPTKLTQIEMALIKEHAQVGYDILKNIDFPWPIAQIAYQHHERLDGSGYPRGLQGDQIILEARIMAVADVVESMT